MKTLSDNHENTQDAAVRIAESLERLERRLDEFFKVVLDARFPHGRGTDRWAGRRSA